MSTDTTDPAEAERQGILFDLGSPDEEMRRLAVERLRSLSAAEALPHLLDGLGDSSWRVRKAAVERLIACADIDGVETALIESLSDGENSGRRNSAFEALVGIGARLTPKLLEALSSDDVDVRKLVVDVLAAIGDPSSCAAMIDTLADRDPNVRGAAADALGVVGDAAAGQALYGVAVDAHQDSLVRLSALRALARIEHTPSVAELQPLLEDSVLRPAAYTLLGQLTDADAIASLLKGVTLESRASRESAMSALLGILAEIDGSRVDAVVEQIREATLSSDEVVIASIERLADADLTTRMMLTQFLGLTGDARTVVPILTSGLDEAMTEIAQATLEGLGAVTVSALSESWQELSVELRVNACSLIGRMGGNEANPLLLASLDDADSQLRAAAAKALGRHHCMEALPILVRRLEGASQDDDPDAEEEVVALIDALVALAPPERPETSSAADDVIDLLSSRLNGAGDEVRLAIASVLGRIGRHQDEEMVAGLLKDPNDRVRRAAVEALARLEPGTASEPLRLALADESPLVRIAAAVSLGQSENPAVIADLQRLIHDEDDRVSAAAVRSIGSHCCRDNVPVESAVEMIGHALRCDGIVALAGLEALGMIGAPEAARAAVTVLDRPEPELVQSAIACIGAHGDAETVAELCALISHATWSVRSEAIQTLAERRVTRAVPPILRRLETEQDSFVRDAILRALRLLED